MRCTSCLEPVDPAVAKFCAKCGASLDTHVDPLVGQVIGGRYRVLHLLAEGGMGRVYAAEQTMGESVRKVAIKVLLAEYSGRDQDVQRLARECSTVAELEHPNTIKFYDYGETREGDLFIAMEFLSGEPLAQLVKSGPLPPERVDLIVGQICGSLYEAHARGIVHRDLKPDNIILTSPGGAPDFVKVLDFGIAKRVGGRDPKLTPLGVVLGSPPYMSPEQFTMQEVDPRSDVYSLGVVAYQLLTGKLPFNANEPIEWAALHMGAAPTPIDSHGVPIPPTMREAIHRALAKEPKDRPTSMREFYAEFTIGLGTLEPGRLSSMLPAAVSSLPFPPPPRAPSDVGGLARGRSEPPRRIPSTVPTAPQGSARGAAAAPISNEPSVISASPAATSDPPPSSEAPTRVRDEDSVAPPAEAAAEPFERDPVLEVRPVTPAEADAPATIRDASPPVSDDGEQRAADGEPATTRDSEPSFASGTPAHAEPLRASGETAALRSKKGTLVMAASQPPPKPPMPDLIPPTIRDPSVAGVGRGRRRVLLFAALALIVAGAIASALAWVFYFREPPKKPKPKPKPKGPATSEAPPG